MADVHAYIDDHMSRFRDELDEFLRIPSVSAKSEHRSDMRAAAVWLAERMGEAGLDVSVEETAGFPIVVGEYRDAGVALGWLIDPTERRVHVYRPDREPEILHTPDKLSAEPELPGFGLDLAPIWQPG